MLTPAAAGESMPPSHPLPTAYCLLSRLSGFREEVLVGGSDRFEPLVDDAEVPGQREEPAAQFPALNGVVTVSGNDAPGLARRLGGPGDRLQRRDAHRVQELPRHVQARGSMVQLADEIDAALLRLARGDGNG